MSTDLSGLPVPLGAESARAIELVRAGDLDGARALLRHGRARTADGARADLVLAAVELLAGAPVEAAVPLRRVAAGEDPVTGPLAAVSLVALDGGDLAPLPGLAAELTGDLLTARVVYEATPTPLGRVLLAGLLARTGGTERARELLIEAARSPHPHAATYAGYLLGGLLAEAGEAQAAEEALRRGCVLAQDRRDATCPLQPWVAARLAETLVDREASPDVIREVAGWALPAADGDGPTVGRLVLGVLDGDPRPASDALARLRAWSPERYAYGSRLATWLGARVVELSTDRVDHPLGWLLAGLDAHPVSAAYALWAKGRRRCWHGDREAAITLWEQAVEIGVLPYARWAGTCLSVLHTLRRDGDAARHALRHGVAIICCVNMGDRFRQNEWNDDARVAYELALSSDEPLITSRAWLGLGHLDSANDPSSAAEAFRQALALGQGAVAISAGHALSGLLEELGDGAGAIEVAREAQRRCAEEGFSPSARALIDKRLGDLQRQARDWRGATEAYRACLDAHREATGQTYPHEARWPLLYLGAVEGLAGEYEASTGNLMKLLEMYSAPKNAEEREITVMAALHLGMNAKFRRDLDEALPWFTKVIDSADMNHIPTAVAHLAELYYWLDDRPMAARLYEQILEMSEDPEYVAEAAYRVGEFLVETTDPVDTPRVIALLERTLGSSFTGFDDDARALLARLRI